MLEVRDAIVPDEVPVVRALFEEYARAMGFDLCFQNFAAELAGLPGAYAPPAGRLLLAWMHGETAEQAKPSPTGEAAGCVALRPLVSGCCSTGVPKLVTDSPDTAEVKRLYVPPRFRGRGIGRALAERVLAEAVAAGYRRACLDTLPSMTEAIGLYRSLGFEPVAPYYENPVPGALFFARELGPK
jgi:ribosomal protein S18 acetylase RimI-like enzyme